MTYTTKQYLRIKGMTFTFYTTSPINEWFKSLNPQFHYLRTCKSNKEQIKDYATIKNMKVEDVERWLGSVLAY